MRPIPFVVSLAVGVFAASNVAFAQAQQSGSSKSAQSGVYSAAPLHSDSMVALRGAAQRLRETIQSLAQEPAGPKRQEAMHAAQKALLETQQAMINLPPEYRVSGHIVANVPITHGAPGSKRTYGDAMKELQLAADRLRDSIQEMAQEPAGGRRDQAIKAAHEALLKTQHAMLSVPGMPKMASSARTDAQGTTATQPAGGSVSGHPNRSGR